ncbi:hydrogenase expression protein HypB [Salipaludibacillus keqinensis]|uniref:Hydrogenase expression protein HypB n=2 Tax=Salipaludibacillus keqinensis TaxID=2045207 RepID=A0A323TE86_9BACI|nr:hydrogenase expression protein HypB [Salipaludibacillus keqinensis]
MNFQDQFVKNVRLYFKTKGEKWLQQLPSLIHYCEETWSLTIKDPYKLSINFVAPAMAKDGREVVVKICLPGEDFLNEREALQSFNGNAMVKLIDSDKEKGIFILEKLSPGFTLAELKDDREACRLATKILQKLTTPAPNESKLPSTKAREQSLRDIVADHKHSSVITMGTLQKALKIFTHLNQTTTEWQILHGDFHHYNLLYSEDKGWKAIDPKGLIGEREYDLIQFMLNHLPDKGAYEVVANRVDIFIDELNLNKERLILWGYCHTVLATYWSIDDDGTFDKSFHQCIEIFEELYETLYGSISEVARS